MAIHEFGLSIDDFQNPKVYKNTEAILTLLTRLLLLEPGTIQSHPEMGVGLISRYRYSVEGNAQLLQSDFQRQLDKYLPQLQGTKVLVSEKGSSYFITAEFERVLYGISFDTQKSTVTTDTMVLSDL